MIDIQDMDFGEAVATLIAHGMTDTEIVDYLGVDPEEYVALIRCLMRG
jgi:hypothetical protein